MDNHSKVSDEESEMDNDQQWQWWQSHKRNGKINCVQTYQICNKVLTGVSENVDGNQPQLQIKAKQSSCKTVQQVQVVLLSVWMVSMVAYHNLLN